MLDSARIQVTLPASDLGRAKAWYHENLDLKPVEESDSGAEAWYELGGDRFLLYQSEFAGTNKATAAAISVDDFDGTIGELRNRGVAFEDYDFGDDFRTVDGVLTTPDGFRAAWLKDSEGNIIAVTSGD